MESPVLIVGGGMAGLACARRLAAAGRRFELFEGSERLGGRVGSVRREGYTLDTGFQVYLDAYPTAAEFLDLEGLGLRGFCSGALVARGGRFEVLADPLRHPGAVWRTLRGPLPVGDLLRLGGLSWRLRGWDAARALSVREESTLEFLRGAGFSEAAVERFWRPFLGGIFLEGGLATSSRMFHFVFGLFARGRATLPRGGMQAIPDQMAAVLPPGAVHLRSRVAEVTAEGVRLESGEWRAGSAVVDARDPWSGEAGAGVAALGTSCFYVTCERVPWTAPWLVLCPECRRINTLTALTRVHPEYAPAGRQLLSVSCLGTEAGEGEVMDELRGLFGDRAGRLSLLERVDVPFSLPAQPVGVLGAAGRSGRRADGVWRCGDGRETASLEGAVVSGKRVADELCVRMGR